MWLVWLLLVPSVACQWNSEELGLYDLVEEVGVNFYDFFGITREASINQIKKAYRNLTLVWHPDRNNAPDATDKFRQVAGIYEVLKSKELREKYDNILDNGLPTWRQPVFYYRRMRKLSWYEGVLVLLFVATIAHYCMMWASYFEKGLVYKQQMKKSKSRKDKTKAEDEAAELREALAPFRPKATELLPVLLCRGTVTLLKDMVVVAKYFMEKRNTTDKQEEEEDLSQKPRRVVPHVPQPVYEFEVARDLKPVSTLDPEAEKKYAAENKAVAKKQSIETWTPDELANLVRLSTEKYPAGTPNRWDQIGRVLCRDSEDVIAMAGKLKQMKQEEYSKLLMRQSTAITEGSKSTSEIQTAKEEWTQNEQKAFERALQTFPKGVDERWDRIAEAVNTKSKKQCMQRFKELAELIKKKKNEN